MNPNARPYRPIERKKDQASSTPPTVGMLTGWPAFPPHSLPVHGSTRSSASRPPPANPPQGLFNPGVVKIESTPTYQAELNALVHSLDELKTNGYVLDDLTEADIEAEKRCEMCNKRIRLPRKFNKPYRGKNSNAEFQQGSAAGTKTEEGTPAPWNKSRAPMSAPNADTPKHATTEATRLNSTTILPNGHPDADDPPPKLICHFHPGVVDQKQRIWTCCMKALNEPPCAGFPEHTPIVYAPGQLEYELRYYRTPLQPMQLSAVRFAVAIDCEMGVAVNGDSELIRVTLLDYFSGSILVDRLVYPDAVMAHFNTRYSGVSRPMMETARKNGTCVMGKAQAREAVWRYVGPQTIVIGHSAHNDLKAMRWIHGRIIDSFLLEPKPVVEEDKDKENGKEKDGTVKSPTSATPTPTTGGELQKEANAEEQKKAPKPKGPKKSGPRALKTLARVKLGRDIQNHGKLGHDSLEDAMAARDLVHWQILDRRQQQRQQLATGKAQ